MVGGMVVVRPQYGVHPAVAAAMQTRAMAAAVEAQGVYNYLSAEATVRLAEADRLAIENRKQRVETYFALRESNKSHHSAMQASNLAKRSSPPAAKPVASASRPRPVIDLQFGRIAWPTVLRDEAYRGHRQAVETIFARCSSGNGVSAADREALLDAVQGLLSELESHIDEVKPSEYIAGKQFLKTLASEAKSRMG